MLILNQQIEVDSYAHYEQLVSKGFQPLVDWKHFVLDIHLRVEIQRYVIGRSYFGRGSVVEANQRYYRFCWKHKPHVCEETTRPLYYYSSVSVSHILSRGAHPEMASDPRNSNILRKLAHDMWDDETRKKDMRIYEMNMMIIEMLEEDYNKL